MAATGGGNGPAVSQQLRDQAHQFDFFQAVRVLHWMAHEPSAAKEPRRPLGYDFAPGREVVRFRSLAAHSFPTGPVVEVRPPRTDGAPEEMTTTFLGLTGPQGVLPQHYTALVIERVRAKDYSLCDFLDVFNHRALSLFYRAWQKYRFPFAYEDAAIRETGNEDLFTQGLYCLLGLGTGGLRARAEFDDEALLYFAGHFAHWPRSAVALEGILNEYFQLPAAVKQFQGQWIYMAEEDRSSLPSPGRSKGQYTQIGSEAVIGQRVWDVEGKFRIRLGPLSYAEFCRLLPNGDILRPLCEMARLYVGPHLEFDIQLVLKRREVPRCRLGGDTGAPAERGDGSRLGWNTWVRHGEFQIDVSDAIFTSKV
ncbi:MAG: type VI secretion system baseplate subunit TssG [Thermoguttaceae bacterium]